MFVRTKRIMTKMTSDTLKVGINLAKRIRDSYKWRRKEKSQIYWSIGTNSISNNSF